MWKTLGIKRITLAERSEKLFNVWRPPLHLQTSEGKFARFLLLNLRLLNSTGPLLLEPKM